MSESSGTSDKPYLLSSLSNWSFCCRSFCRSLSLRSSLLTSTTCGLLSRSLRSLEHVLVVVNELDDTHLSSITKTETSTEDTCVTTWTVSDLLCYVLEELGNNLFLFEFSEDETAVSCGVLFCMGTRPPYNYEESRSGNQVDLLASGIFASHYINTVSPTFLLEVVNGMYSFVPEGIRNEIAGKYHAGCASGILNSPDADYNPEEDPALTVNYSAASHVEGKRENKMAFQKRTGLTVDPEAPLFFWPHRLDPAQKGCPLLANILYHVIDKYYHNNLQIAIVANGSYQQIFRDIVAKHDFYDRVTVCDFDEDLSRLGFAASDFMLMPSLFEPCGLPQMISQYYGSLPVVRNTGGLHDTVEHLSQDGCFGNGFRFNDYDDGGLFWGIDEAMRFYSRPKEFRAAVIDRVMRSSRMRFNHDVTAQEYIKIYEAMLERPLLSKVYE